MKRILSLVAAATLFASTGVMAADAPQAANLDQLLDMVRKAQTADSELNKKREEQFRAARDQQAALLNQAKQELNALENEGERLQAEFKRNEEELAKLEEAKTQRIGDLGELFGVVRQVSGDTAARLSRSYISAQFPGREKALETMAQSKGLPKIDDLRQLWVEMQREMTEQGKMAKFNASVTLGDGTAQERQIVRVGAFNLLQNNEYALYNAETKQIQELSRQPSATNELDLAKDYSKASSGIEPVFVDPSRGALLSLVVQAPSFAERFDQGGLVGYIIIFGVLGLGLLIVLERVVALTIMGSKISAQLKNMNTPNDNNPLGRVMKVYFANKNADTENLELKLDEAIMKEVPSIERGIALVKVCAALGPLLGLLGTVTGMIQTFQIITMFGAGDPKLMASGISTALVTTVQGLCTAIPLVFLHTYVSGRSKNIIHVLEEQSTGLLAQHTEK